MKTTLHKKTGLRAFEIPYNQFPKKHREISLWSSTKNYWRTKGTAELCKKLQKKLVHTFKKKFLRNSGKNSRNLWVKFPEKLRKRFSEKQQVELGKFFGNNPWKSSEELSHIPGGNWRKVFPQTTQEKPSKELSGRNPETTLKSAGSLRFCWRLRTRWLHAAEKDMENLNVLDGQNGGSSPKTAEDYALL